MSKPSGIATPLMTQYNKIKSRHADAILLFRVGDFYETFGEDAIAASRVLGVVLTKRKNGAASEIELAGFPYHALDTYLPKLVRAGYRVAICDQLEDPKLAKKVVKRGVTELVTPGVTQNEKILDHNSNNFLASIYFGKEKLGVSFIDISTGEFLLAEGRTEYIDKLMQSFQPAEVIFAKHKQKTFLETFSDQYYTYPLDDWVFTPDYARETLLKHFGTKSLKGFGVEQQEAGVVAAGGALHYLQEMQKPALKHVTMLSRIEEGEYVWLDKFTIRNLELLHSIQDDGTPLIRVVDQTTSPMGARMLKRWLLMPLKDKTAIEQRLGVVEYLIKAPEVADKLRQSIKQIGDLERLVSKVPLGRISPREVGQLQKALDEVGQIKFVCAESDSKWLKQASDKLNHCSILKEKIENELQDDPPAAVDKGNVIAKGVSDALDELRDLIHSSKTHLKKIQEREIKRTGISSLKIGFNNVFGYYLEVRHTHKSKVPSDWTRKQTLTQSERYITEELKDYETKILGAEEKILVLERQLFDTLVQAIVEYIETIQLNCTLLARLDCLLAFSGVAVQHNYRKPTLHEGDEIEIQGGRHPVIEQELPAEDAYIPNDVVLDNEKQQILIITGPNMSGKSALLRQTALIVLLAQAGSFVPAKEARIGLVDKVFTRVGASDNIASGESTFMVEMNETASIINNISDRSLILLDEIGRGTSTYDGISLAWAITEYLHNNKARPKTLFATHYHELNELEKTLERVKNFNVSVKEAGNKVIFLRKLKPGGSEHSFGIHVARMAGMPQDLLQRAKSVMQDLEKRRGKGAKVEVSPPDSDYQLNLFQLDDPKLAELRKELDAVDINTITPMDAMMKLHKLKDALNGKEE